MVQVPFLRSSQPTLLDKVSSNFTSGSSSSSVEAPPIVVILLALLGTFTVVRFVYSFLFFLNSTLASSGTSLTKYGAPKKRGAGQGSWAVVTGASDGIGREFALQLAKRGFGVVLASRTKSKLDDLAAEIAKVNTDVQTKVVAIDFGARGEKAEQGWSALAQAVQGLDVGVLVNNVGVSHDMPVSFEETQDAEIESIINVNIVALLRVTKLVLPGMQSRRRGLVLNLGSFAGQFPTPLLATYSASKSFLLSFSQALGAEQKGAKTGVDVIALNTYFVVSAMSKVRRASWMIPTPKQYVSRVLQKVNCKGGAGARPYSATLWPGHAVVDWVISNLLPSENWLLNYSYGQSLSTRKRAIKKAERAAKAQ